MVQDKGRGQARWQDGDGELRVLWVRAKNKIRGLRGARKGKRGREEECGLEVGDDCCRRQDALWASVAKDTWIMGKAARISILGRRPCAAGPPRARLQHSVRSSD